MFARELQSQFGAGQAQAIMGSTAQTFTAAGTTQATAAAISAVNTVITTATEGQGAIIPSGLQPSDTGQATNNTTVDVYLYPPVGGKINGGTVNIPYMLSPQSSVQYGCIDGTNFWADR